MSPWAIKITTGTLNGAFHFFPVLFLCPVFHRILPLFFSSPLSFCHLFIWTPIAVSGKCAFGTYRERHLVSQREHLLHCTVSCKNLPLCFSIPASSFCASLASLWLAIPTVLNHTCQPPSHTPQYAIFSAAFPGQGLYGNGLAGIGLNTTMSVRTTERYRVTEP